MNHLTNKQKDICSYTGLFGAMLSATCLIQLILITREHWISFAMLAIYLFAILVFVLLILQKSIAPWLLIIVAVLLFAAELVFVFSGIFSLVILLSFIYCTIIVITLFAEHLPQKLKEKALAEKAEALIWKDKI